VLCCVVLCCVVLCLRALLCCVVLHQSYFQQFLNYFSWINLNLVPWNSLSCLTSINFYTKLTVGVLVPIGALILLAIVPTVMLYVADAFDMTDRSGDRRARKLARLKIVKLFTFLLFLIYPLMSQLVLSFFQCRTVNGTPYLIVDFSLVCYDAQVRPASIPPPTFYRRARLRSFLFGVSSFTEPSVSVLLSLCSTSGCAGYRWL
jgi:hypothetical protein